MAEIRILDMTPDPSYDYRSPRYKFHTSFPWTLALTKEWATKEEAFQDAQKWIADYVRRDPYGNMGNAIGVAQRGDKFVGVVNYFHSNT